MGCEVSDINVEGDPVLNPDLGEAAVLKLSPATVTLAINTTQAFTATGGLPPYRFDVLLGIGTIDASGLYSAGPSAGTAVVRLQDSRNTVSTATVTVVTSLRERAAEGPAESIRVAHGGWSRSSSGDDGEISLKWNEMVPSADVVQGYNLYRAGPDGERALATGLPAWERSYEDRDPALAAGGTYRYLVRPVVDGREIVPLDDVEALVFLRGI